MRNHIQARLAEVLAYLGFRENPDARSTRYRVFDRPDGVPYPRHYYVGRSGALRTGNTISESIPVERLRDQLLAFAAKLH